MRILFIALAILFLGELLRRLLALERRLTALADQQIQARLECGRRLEALERGRPLDEAVAEPLIQIQPRRRSGVET